MGEEPNKEGRMKYLLPWIGMAVVIGMLWALVAE